MIELDEESLACILRILQNIVPECEVRAFGSRVIGNSRKYSDLDLAIVGESAIDWQTMERLKEAFAESDLTFIVDILDWATTQESFRKIINEKFEVIQKAGKSSKILSGS